MNLGISENFLGIPRPALGARNRDHGQQCSCLVFVLLFVLFCRFVQFLNRIFVDCCRFFRGDPPEKLRKNKEKPQKLSQKPTEQHEKQKQYEKHCLARTLAACVCFCHMIR